MSGAMIIGRDIKSAATEGERERERERKREREQMACRRMPQKDEMSCLIRHTRERERGGGDAGGIQSALGREGDRRELLARVESIPML